MTQCPDVLTDKSHPNLIKKKFTQNGVAYMSVFTEISFTNLNFIVTSRP